MPKEQDLTVTLILVNVADCICSQPCVVDMRGIVRVEDSESWGWKAFEREIDMVLRQGR